MQSLTVGKPDHVDRTESHDVAETIDNAVIDVVKARTKNFAEPMTMEEATLVTRWAKQYHVKLAASTRRNIRQARKAERHDKSTFKKQINNNNKTLSQDAHKPFSLQVLIDGIQAKMGRNTEGEEGEAVILIAIKSICIRRSLSSISCWIQ